MISSRATGALVLTLAAIAGSGIPIGSINVYGTVRVGEATIPSGATLFAGQLVTTGREGRALVTLASRAGIALGPNTRARINPNGVVLDQAGSPVFQPGLRVEPAEPDTAAEATQTEGGRVTIAVQAGMVRVIDPTGASLRTIAAGQAFLFGLAAQESQGRSGGQAPGLPRDKEKEKEDRKKGASTPQSKPPKEAGAGGGSKTALYVVIGLAAAGGGVGAALAGGKRGS